MSLVFSVLSRFNDFSVTVWVVTIYPRRSSLALLDRVHKIRLPTISPHRESSPSNDPITSFIASSWCLLKATLMIKKYKKILQKIWNWKREVPHQMNEHLDWPANLFASSAALRHRKLEESSISNFKQQILFQFSSYILLKAILLY